MAATIKYGRPQVAGMDPEIGRKVIQEILSSPVPDRKKMHEEAKRLEKEMIKVLERDAENEPK